MNSILSAFSLYKTYIMVAALIAVLVAEFVYVRGVYVNEGTARVVELQAKFDRAVAASQAELFVKERALFETNHQLEKQNVMSKQAIDAANKRHTDYVATHGLRDPGVRAATSNHTNNSSIGTSKSPESCNSGELSVEASGFLLELTKEADELAQDYATCMQWTQEVTSITHSHSSSDQP